MRKRFIGFALAAAVTLTACGNNSAVENEIQIPIYNNDGGETVSTAVVEYRDLSDTKTVGCEIGYVYAVDVCTEVSGNLVSFNVERAQELKEGDTIAVLDSSSLDYEYQSQKLLTDDAYNNYINLGGERNRLLYEESKAVLDSIQYKIDRYTVKAPYDCVVTSVGRYDVGSSLDIGSAMCTIVKPDEIYVYATSDTKYFSLGTKLEIKFTTKDRYKGTVVMRPQDIVGNDSYGVLKNKGININDAVIISLDDGERERLLADIPNAVSAGWATIYVTSAEKYHVLAVPDSAVKQFSGATYCNVLENEQKLQIPVETGASMGGYTIILNGLSEGDTVVI